MIRRRFLPAGAVFLLCLMSLFFYLSERESEEEADPAREETAESFGTLETLHLEMEEEDLDYIKEEKGNPAYAWYEMKDADGVILFQGKADRIRTRGNSTWYMPKKSYSLKLDEGIDWNGSGEERSWNLLAVYLDGSYLRSETAQQIARAGNIPYSPGGGYVDLYINGSYEGIYYLCENVKAKDERKKNVLEVSMELDFPERLEEGETYFTLENDQPMLVHSPSNLSEEEIEEVRERWMECLTLMETEPESDAIWEKLDLDSWAGMYIMEEILQDTDIGGASRYFFLRREAEGERIYAGPAWDMDQALGNDWEEAEGFWVERQNLASNNLCRWYMYLCRNQTFRRRVMELYEADFSPKLHELAETGIARLAEEIAPSVPMDLERWGGERTIRNPGGTFEEYVQTLTDYVEKRADFLDRMWIEESGSRWKAADVPAIQDMEAERGSLALSNHAEAEAEEALSLFSWFLQNRNWIMLCFVAAAAVFLFILDLQKNRNRHGKKR